MAKKHNDNAFKQRLAEKGRRTLVIHETYKAHLVMALYTLRKDFGYGNKRLERFITEFNKTLQCYNDGYVEYEDIRQLLEDEVKIKIE